MNVIYENDHAVAYDEMVAMTDGVRLHTTVIKPKNADKCPIVLYRTPYDAPERLHEIAKNYADSAWLREGFAIVRQDVRGKGLSEGECHPYQNEREDGLVTHDFVRSLPFYNGEIFLDGRSYLSTVHLCCVTAFGDDIKGAALAIQTDRMYFRNFRNGCSYRIGNATWWLKMLKRRYPNQQTDGLFVRPYIDIMKRAVGEDVPYYTATLENTEYNNFWQSDPRTYASENLKIPVLFTEGWYDFYIEGMHDMWNRLPEETRNKSAMFVGPWGHATAVSDKAEYPLEHGNLPDGYVLEWFKSIREKRPYPHAALGKITYYSFGGDRWSDDAERDAPERLYLGGGTLDVEPSEERAIRYVYDPENPQNCFPGGNIHKAPKPGAINGVVSFLSAPVSEETRYFGKIRWKMDVSTDCDDTAFFIRVYFTENGEAYNLTETIASLCHLNPDYRAGERMTIDVETPPIAFTLKPGCGIRIDIASSGNAYTPHANVRGHWAHVTETKIAHNTIFAGDSFIELPKLRK